MNIHKSVIIWLLAFVGGFVDAAGYIKLYGIFTTSITGNLATAAATISGAGPKGVLCKVMVIVSFMVGCFINETLAMKLKFRYKYCLETVAFVLFMMEDILLILACIFGLIYNDNIVRARSQNSPEVVLIASLLGGSMGMHNVAARETIDNCPSSTAMTMTTVAVATLSSNALFLWLDACGLFALIPPPLHNLSEEENLFFSEQKKERYTKAAKKLLHTIGPLVIFTLGAILGSLITYQISFWSLIIPIAIISLIITERAYCSCSAIPRPPSQTPDSYPPTPDVDFGELHSDRTGLQLLETSPLRKLTPESLSCGSPSTEYFM